MTRLTKLLDEHSRMLEFLEWLASDGAVCGPVAMNFEERIRARGRELLAAIRAAENEAAVESEASDGAGA